MRQIVLTNQYNDRLEGEFIKLFHELKIPLRSNRRGRKGFSNYQRFSVTALFARSRKSLRDFINQFHESKWAKWLQLSKIPSKSTIYNWLSLFSMKIIRKINKLLNSNSSSLTAIDGTGFDSHHRSRHYEKRVGFSKMPYAKADLFVDLSTKKIIDFSLVNKHQHDIVAGREFVKRNDLNGVTILCDGAYDCEDFHKSIVDKGGKLYAPVRKRNKRSLKRFPKGWFRKQCLKLPDFMGKRSIIEAVNSCLKRRFIISLRSKSDFTKEIEFGWAILVYNLDRKLMEKNEDTQKKITFFILILI